MIRCKNLTKQYGGQVVLSDFSYDFSDTGLYLLYGESGSGKTTLINVLSGMLPFEGGTVEINGRTFGGISDPEAAGLDFDYITQDTFFADFLTVSDNLMLICRDAGKIPAVLEQFGLSGKEDQYPQTLSGGEKQRLAMARACLSGKKLLFLDEPTASLDGKNKKAILDLLSELKNDALIICSSHDEMAVGYADAVIPFEKCSELRPAPAKKEKKPHRSKGVKKQSPPHLFRYLKKWFSSKKRSRGADVRFCIFLVLALLLIFAGDLPEHKKTVTYEKRYRINALYYRVNERENDHIPEIAADKRVAGYYLDYNWSLPAVEPENDGDAMVDVVIDYEVTVPLLPTDPDMFGFPDMIEYGSYFTGKNQIILSYGTAEQLMPGRHGELVGQTLSKSLYKLGDIKFTIVGVFREPDRFEEKCLNSFGAEIDGMYYSSDTVSRFLEDKTALDDCNQRAYCLLVDSYSDRSDFLADHKELIDGKDGQRLVYSDRLAMITEEELITFTSIAFLPLSLLIAMFTVLFYTSLIKTEVSFNGKFISVFDYSGYPVKKVVNCFMLIHFLRLIMMSLIAFAAAFVLAEGVNLLNGKLAFFALEIFTPNVLLIAAFFAITTVFSLIGTAVMFRKLKKISWYENIISRRDLI